jgi:hypothetical protein
VDLIAGVCGIVCMRSGETMHSFPFVHRHSYLSRNAVVKQRYQGMGVFRATHVSY